MDALVRSLGVGLACDPREGNEASEADWVLTLQDGSVVAVEVTRLVDDKVKRAAVQAEHDLATGLGDLLRDAPSPGSADRYRVGPWEMAMIHERIVAKEDKVEKYRTPGDREAWLVLGTGGDSSEPVWAGTFAMRPVASSFDRIFLVDVGRGITEELEVASARRHGPRS